MTKTPNVPVSPGELLDKIVILEIKKERILDSQKLKNVHAELELLCSVHDRATYMKDKKIDDLRSQLKSVNEKLWEIEDAIRLLEKNKNFGENFISVARSVYKQNDERSNIKRKINDLLGSVVVEEKSYERYD